MIDYKPILVLDFDGVVRPYTSDWPIDSIIQDLPVNDLTDKCQGEKEHDFIERVDEITGNVWLECRYCDRPLIVR